MRILVIGDSLTAGRTGVSFVRLIRSKRPHWNIVSKGISGEPLYNIGERLISILKKDARFDYVVIEAGMNDLLLPALESRGGLYRWSIRREKRYDIKPLDDIEKFRTFYAVLLKEARLHTTAGIVLLNISRINEGGQPSAIAMQQAYNRVIAELASQARYRLADVAGEFSAILESEPGSDYLLPNFWNTILWDHVRSKFHGGAEKLSRVRKLRLTVDGVHLNRRGAQIYAEVIVQALGPHGSSD